MYHRYVALPDQTSQVMNIFNGYTYDSIIIQAFRVFLGKLPVRVAGVVLTQQVETAQRRLKLLECA